MTRFKGIEMLDKNLYRRHIKSSTKVIILLSYREVTDILENALGYFLELMYDSFLKDIKMQQDMMMIISIKKLYELIKSLQETEEKSKGEADEIYPSK